MQATKRVGTRLRLSQIPTVFTQPQLRTLAICTCQAAQRPATSTPQISYIFQGYRAVSAEATARELSQQSVDELAEDVDEDNVAEAKDKQHKRPWMREGVDHAPVRRQRSAGAMTKGKLLGSDDSKHVLTEVKGSY